ncbi:MAG: beta-lactamase family protein [Myxococcales bacterium]|nr:beta-lactamase family protein [Myxococcales bacterium]MCB9715127.1 beta-lactamase family protein [Myxococcales bacterium]
MTNIGGTCEPRFHAVRDQLERNLVERGEVGASVCVMLDGEVVVDLYGGVADRESGRPWTEDTVSLVFSSTKGATALCAHMLADRGELDLDAPIAEVWPELAKGGKERIRVGMLLDHQAGLPALRSTIPPGGLYDWQWMIHALEDEAPFWRPGTRHGYHALTMGYLVGEVVRRVSGRTLGTFFAEEVADPLGLDFWIGLPESEEGRVAPIIPAVPPSDPAELGELIQVAMGDPSSIQFLVLMNSGGFLEPGECDSRAAHAAEIPAANGITNARGLARMYAPLALGGALGGVRLVSPEAISRMSAVRSAVAVDATLLTTTRFSLGYMKRADNRWTGIDGDSVLLAEEAFGHAGMGGSVGFADPTLGLSFGYTMSQQGMGVGINGRGHALIDATYASLGLTPPGERR